MPEPDRKQLVYRINASADLVFVDENWDSFFHENAAGRAVAKVFLGSCLWRHFSDASTVNLYQALVARARKVDHALVVPFRCDAPGKRRYMEMHVQSVAAGEIEFRSVLIREEARPPVELLDVSAPRNQDLIYMCSWCKKIRIEGSWIEVEDAVRGLGLFHSVPLPRISHTICPPCAEQVRRELVRPQS